MKLKAPPNEEIEVGRWFLVSCNEILTVEKNQKIIWDVPDDDVGGAEEKLLLSL